MTLTQQIITIALCALGTMATRFLPFLLFSSRKPTPGYIRYLGNALPAAGKSQSFLCGRLDIHLIDMKL